MVVPTWKYLYNAYPTHEKHVPTISTDFFQKVNFEKSISHKGIKI